jgi:hypothetical protein
MENQYRLRIGGTAANNNLTANLILRFPFKGGTGKFYSRPRGNRGTRAVITIQQMIKEMQAIHRDEVPKIAKWFHYEYMRLVENHRANRKRLRPRKS